jgi:cyclophilin family peptidyl-prolyl cis-trans isomerase
MLAVVAMGVPLGACGDDDDGDETTAAEGTCAEVEGPAPKDEEFQPSKEPLTGKVTALVETSCGDFTIELDTQRAPKTTASFAGLVEQGLYDGTSIHRVEPGFVIQGGDPQGTGEGGPGYFVDEPPPSDLSYTRGTVAMAKTQVEPPGRSGSQFFVVTAPADAGLPPDYALLGRVTGSFEAIEAIEALGAAGGMPSRPVVIERVTLQTG